MKFDCANTCNFVEISTADDSLMVDHVSHTVCAFFSDELNRGPISQILHLSEYGMEIVFCSHGNSIAEKNSADGMTAVLFWPVQKFI